MSLPSYYQQDRTELNTAIHIPIPQALKADDLRILHRTSMDIVSRICWRLQVDNLFLDQLHYPAIAAHLKQFPRFDLKQMQKSVKLGRKPLEWLGANQVGLTDMAWTPHNHQLLWIFHLCQPGVARSSSRRDYPPTTTTNVLNLGHLVVLLHGFERWLEARVEKENLISDKKRLRMA
jgi:hypothetical protein